MKLQVKSSRSSIGKRLWKVVKIAFRVIGKGLISKAKVMHTSFMDNRSQNSLMIKRSLMDMSYSYHYDGCHGSSTRSFSTSSLVEYEFSCNNSPVLFYPFNKKKKSSFPFFSASFQCLSFPEVFEKAFGRHDRVVSPNMTPEPDSPEHFLEDESDGRVDHDAEDFIRRFYEQLKGQSPLKLRFG